METGAFDELLSGADTPSLIQCSIVGGIPKRIQLSKLADRGLGGCATMLTVTGCWLDPGVHLGVAVLADFQSVSRRHRLGIRIPCQILANSDTVLGSDTRILAVIYRYS